MTTIKMDFKCVAKWKYADPIVPAIHGLPQWYKDKKAYGEEQMRVYITLWSSLVVGTGSSLIG